MSNSPGSVGWIEPIDPLSSPFPHHTGSGTPSSQFGTHTVCGIDPRAARKGAECWTVPHAVPALGTALCAVPAPVGLGPALHVVFAGAVCSMGPRLPGAGTAQSTDPLPAAVAATCGICPRAGQATKAGPTCSVAPTLAGLGSVLHDSSQTVLQAELIPSL